MNGEYFIYNACFSCIDWSTTLYIFDCLVFTKCTHFNCLQFVSTCSHLVLFSENSRRRWNNAQCTVRAAHCKLPTVHTRVGHGLQWLENSISSVLCSVYELFNSAKRVFLPFNLQNLKKKKFSLKNYIEEQEKETRFLALCWVYYNNLFEILNVQHTVLTTFYY